MDIYRQGDGIAANASPHSHTLRRLMDDRGLHAVYQPILDVRQGRHFACEALIRGPENSALHTPAALFADGGYCGEDRRGRAVFHPLPALSIGCVMVQPGTFASHHDVSAALGEAKKQAKRIPGSTLFVERRQYQACDALQDSDAAPDAVSPTPTSAPPPTPCMV